MNVHETHVCLRLYEFPFNHSSILLSFFFSLSVSVLALPHWHILTCLTALIQIGNECRFQSATIQQNTREKNKINKNVQRTLLYIKRMNCMRCCDIRFAWSLLETNKLICFESFVTFVICRRITIELSLYPISSARMMETTYGYFQYNKLLIYFMLSVDLIHSLIYVYCMRISPERQMHSHEILWYTQHILCW